MICPLRNRLPTATTKAAEGFFGSGVNGSLARCANIVYPGANTAVMRAEALSRKPGCAGALAFSRTGDPATGEFGDAKGDPEVRRHSGRSERAVMPAKLDWVRNEITRMPKDIHAQEREIWMLQRAVIPTASAELLLTRLRAKFDDLCRERTQLRKSLPPSIGA
jgi:hypothetical protein